MYPMNKDLARPTRDKYLKDNFLSGVQVRRESPTVEDKRMRASTSMNFYKSSTEKRLEN